MSRFKFPTFSFKLSTTISAEKEYMYTVRGLKGNIFFSHMTAVLEGFFFAAVFINIDGARDFLLFGTVAVVLGDI